METILMMMEIMTTYKDKTTVCKAKLVVRKITWLSTILLTTFAVVTLTGCVNDELHNTPHPDKGALRITTDWTGLSKDAVPPESYLLRIGDLTHTVSGVENTFNQLLPEGSYTLFVHNTPAGVTLNGAKAEVNTLPDGTLELRPDYLFSAATDFSAIKDDTLNVGVKMVQSLRILQLRLKLSAADLERIASTAATLTGIAHRIDLATGQAEVAGTGKTVAPVFLTSDIHSARAYTPTLVALMRLADVASEKRQMLTLLFTLTDGSVVPIEEDLTELLKDFGKKKKPLLLDGEVKLPEKPTEMGVAGTITDWKAVTTVNGSAEMD
ncbi:MAG: FimB/Mfa2 family fimbrial subunit [Odoribacter sp.]